MDKKNIVEGLKSLGLKEGNIVLLHSSLASLGYVDGGAEAVVEAFLEVLGASGTLAVPVFGDLGIITKIVRGDSRSITSQCPVGTISAIGADAEYICKDHWKTESCHAEGTPYLKIAEKGGCICLLGVDQDRNTTLHSVEALLKLPYLENTSEKTFETDEGNVTKSWKYYPGPHRDFIGLDKYLRQSGKMKIGKIGNSVIRLIKSRDLLDICSELGQKNPAFALCDNPNCADCVSQKAAIKRHKFNSESFKLAASSALAGRYVPEIIENMNAVGIDVLELDAIQGKPVAMISDEALKKAVEELRENGIEISSLKISFNPENIDGILDKACANSIARITMPLSSEAGKHIKKADEKNIGICFFNKGLDSDKTTSLLMKLKEEGVKPEFAFSPAEFVSCGEKPFLGSYKKKLRKFISQIYVEDTLFDSSPARLAEGNAEIKELISILRCSNFSGHFILSGANRFAGDLKEAVQSLENLLENM